MRCPQRGLSIKQLASLDMIVLSSPSLDSGKRSVSLWFQRKEANEPFTGNLSALFIEAAWGACSQPALAVQESCHGCWGLEI